MSDTEAEIVRRYNFKLYPTHAQAAALDRIRRLHATFYNAALQERIDAYRLAGKTLTQYDQSKHIKVVRADDPDYAALSADSLNGTLARLDRAFQAFFRRARAGQGAQSGFPRYKRSDDYPGFWHRWKNGWAMTLGPSGKSGRMYVKGVPGELTFRGRFPAPPTRILTCDIRLEGGVWWASVAVRIAARMRQDHEYKGEVVFDLVETFARIRRVDRGHAAGPDDAGIPAEDGRIIQPHLGVGAASGAHTPETGGDRGGKPLRSSAPAGAHTPETGGDRGSGWSMPFTATGAHTQEAGGDRGAKGETLELRPGAHTPGTGGDRGTTPYEAAQRVERLQRRMATCKRGSQRYRRLRRLKARIEARAARQRRERLHVWTTAIARTFAELTIVSPSIKETTRSGRGTERSHGAAVAVKAALNRHILAMAPATAVAMLEYKIAERGGMAQVVRAGSHPAELGNAIVSATQENRKLRRAIRNAH